MGDLISKNPTNKSRHKTPVFKPSDVPVTRLKHHNVYRVPVQTIKCTNLHAPSLQKSLLRRERYNGRTMYRGKLRLHK